MAEKKATKPVKISAEEKKRRLKIKDPETFRERALKAAEQADKPKHFVLTRKVLAAVWDGFTFVPRKAWAWANKFKAFRIIRKPFHWLSLVIIPPYIRNSWKELRQVTWPGFKQGWRLTFAVLAFAVIFGLVLAGVDYGLDRLFKDVLLK